MQREEKRTETIGKCDVHVVGYVSCKESIENHVVGQIKVGYYS